jgi:pre-60S factor REI1
VTEALFLTRQSALAQEESQSSETPMLYSCGLCGKGYRSSKAHAEHLKSRSHIIRASQGTNNDEEDKAIVKPLSRRVVNQPPPRRESKDEESEESEWEEADPEEDLVGEAMDSLTDLNVHEPASDDDMDDNDDDDDDYELDPSCCFMCDLEHDTLESCMVHMHKQHGFFIPDVEYLKDPKGLLTYLGLKVLKHLLSWFLVESRNLFLIFHLFS